MMGVYDQLGITIVDPEQTVLEYVVEHVQARDGSTSSEDPNEARLLLKQFLFPRQRWHERVSVLSGGERRRLQMLAVFSQRPNCLLMDEPSVDCDLDTLNALESYLQSFDGVLILVSHDRAFADKVTDHLFVFEGDGEVKDFGGSLSEYASTLVELESQAVSGAKVLEKEADSKKGSYKEDKAKRNEERNMIRQAKKEMEKVENAIEKLKEKALKLEHEIDKSSGEGWSVLADLTDKLNKINAEIEERELQWIEFAEKLEEAEVDV